MALDPNIALGVKPIELANPLAQYGMVAQIQHAQNQNRLADMQMQEYQRARAEEEGARNFLRGKDLTAAETISGLPQFGKTGLAYAEKLINQRKTGLETDAAQFKLTNDKLKHGWQSMGEASTPQAAIEKLNAGVKNGYFDMKTASAEIQKLQSMTTPDQYKAYRVEKIMGLLDAKDQLAAVSPKIARQEAGGQILNIQDNPLLPGYGLPVQGMAPIAKTMTFADKVAQGQLKVAQDKLAKEGTNLDPAENAAISKAIIEGRLDPNRVNGRNAKILATTLLANPDANLLELGVSAAGATAAEKSLSTQTAKMSTAANEANKMVDVVRGLSDKVDRGEFPTINAISNAVSKGTGGKEIVQLNTSINALVNSYARAISPTGQPTVSDKNHAREVINSAYSQGQLGAILDVMQQEMSIARDAAGTASTELKASREAARGRGSEAPAAGPVKISSDADYNKLPSGAVFIAPDGSQRRKP